MTGHHPFEPNSDSRGISNVLGLVLVLGMVIAATMVIVTVGAVTFQNSQSTVSMESAVTAMEELNREILAVASSSSQQQTIEMPSMEDADLAVKETGWVNITIEKNVSGTWKRVASTEEIDLGKIVYEGDEQSVAIQGGGVWRTNEQDRSTAMLVEPTFQYNYGDGNPTLVFPIVNLTGTTVTDGEVHVTNGGGQEALLERHNPFPAEDNTDYRLNVTVKSEYNLGWYGLFKSRTDGTVKKGTETATVYLQGPELISTGDAPGGAVVAPYTGGHFTNSNIIDSYNSNVGNGSYYDPAQIHDKAVVYANGTGKLWVSEKVQINGSLHLDQGFGATNQVTVTGESRFAGEIQLQPSNPTQFGDDVHANNGFAQFGGATIEGDLYVDGDLPYSGGANVKGEIQVKNGSVIFSGGSYNGPRIISEEDVILDWGGASQVNTTIHAQGDVIVRRGVINGTIYAGGTVKVLSGQDIKGEIYAPSPPTGSPSATYEGPPPSIETPDPNKPKAPNPQKPEPLGQALINKINNKSSINGTTTTCGAGCTLQSGDYVIDNLTLSGGDVEFNTSSGDIDVYVKNDIKINDGSEVNVTGDGHVDLWVNGDLVKINDAGTRVGPPDHDATKLTIWMKPGASNQLQMQNGAPTFIGVFRAPGGPTVDGAKILLSNHAEVFGSVMGNPESWSVNAALHFDQALRDLGSGKSVIANGPKDILYLQLSTTTIRVN